MAAGWSAEETRALIIVWGQENVQSQLDTTVLPRTRIRTCTSLSCVSHVRSSYYAYANPDPYRVV